MFLYMAVVTAENDVPNIFTFAVSNHVTEPLLQESLAEEGGMSLYHKFIANEETTKHKQ